MDVRSGKMTFRFQEQSSDKLREEESVELESQIQSQSGVEWSEWSSLSQKEFQTESQPQLPIQSPTRLPIQPQSQMETQSKLSPQPPVLLDERKEEHSVEQLERIIRETNQETKPIDIQLEPSIVDPASHPSTAEGDWVWSSIASEQDESKTHDILEPSLNDPDEQRDFRWHTTGPARTSPWKLIGSIAGAIATGAAFGFIALSLFTGEVRMPAVDTAVPAMGALDEHSSSGPSSTAASSQDSTSGTIPSGTPLTDSVTVNIPSRSTYVLQYGVFKQAEGARTAAAELNKLGFAGVDVQLPGEGQHRVYAAVASKREEAMLLSDAMKDKQLQMYVSNIERPAMTELVFKGDGKLVEQFFQHSDSVQNWLLTQSVASIQTAGTIKSFDKNAMDKLRDDHLKWTQAGERIQNGQSKEAAEKWLKMVQAMNTAISAVNEYNKNPASSHLWKIQQSLIQYSLLEQEWLKQMKA